MRCPPLGTLVAQITWLAECCLLEVPCPTRGLGGSLVPSLGFTLADAKRDVTLTLNIIELTQDPKINKIVLEGWNFC